MRQVGPHAPEMVECVRGTDRSLGELIARLEPRWDETVLMVVSDHDHELVTSHGVDLQAELEARGLPGLVETEGTAALVMNVPDMDTLLTLPAVRGAQAVDADNTIVWGADGVVFGLWLDELRGSQGSPRYDRQVAVIGGGHPAVEQLGEALTAARPHATWWAPTIAGLLDFDLID